MLYIGSPVPSSNRRCLNRCKVYQTPDGKVIAEQCQMKLFAQVHCSSLDPGIWNHDIAHDHEHNIRNARSCAFVFLEIGMPKNRPYVPSDVIKGAWDFHSDLIRPSPPMVTQINLWVEVCHLSDAKVTPNRSRKSPTNGCYKAYLRDTVIIVTNRAMKPKLFISSLNEI